MQRYFLRLGYCGTRLRGIQKQLVEQEEACGSVQGLVEKGLLQRLKPANLEQLYFSSRTDKGVHAVCNTAHVDLLHHTEGLHYEPCTVTTHLNRFFRAINADIRIHKTALVPSTFHARYSAVARRYLYRLAVTPEPVTSRLALEQFLPAAEIDKLYLVRPPFDVELLGPICQLLEGTHDFASFGNAPSKGSPPRETVRAIHSITVTPGRPLMHPSHDPLYSELQFWDVNVRASSFLYRQVRRMVGVLVGVAQRRINLQDVQHMLDNPSHDNWKPQAQVAPPHGLFLLDVEYPPHVFVEGEGEGDTGNTQELVQE